MTEDEKESLKAQISLCDGVILAGGSKSDAYEIWIAKYCNEKDIPLLAICAGQNNMGRAMGGTTKSVENPDLHCQYRKDTVHSVVADPQSKLGKVVGTKPLKVNSRHKRTVDKLGTLQVAGYDEDGNIEMVEDKTKKYFASVRFHPESLYLYDEKHNNIFEQLNTQAT